IFTETKLKGAFIIEAEKHEDDRGFFARSWCQKEFQAHNLNPRIVQCNISFNKMKGTLRGMHYQAGPFAEAKLVRCTDGALYDVIIDLRPDSPTYKQHIGEVLSAANYKMSECYSPHHARGVRYNDPAFAIKWMIGNPIIVDRDRNYPDFTE